MKKDLLGADAAAVEGAGSIESAQLTHAERSRPWPDPTPEMLSDPRFEAVWQCIKRWDINVPDVYGGYMGATGNHVRAILDALSVGGAAVDVQGIAAIAWRCIRECKDYKGPPVMCPAHQEEARRAVAGGFTPLPEVAPAASASAKEGRE